MRKPRARSDPQIADNRTPHDHFVIVAPDVVWLDDAWRRRMASGRPTLLRAGALLNHRFEAQAVALTRSGSCPQRVEDVFNIA